MPAHLHRIHVGADQVPLVLAQAGLRAHVLQVLLHFFPHQKIFRREKEDIKNKNGIALFNILLLNTGIADPDPGFFS